MRDSELRDYLLGKAADVEALEARLLEDDELFERARAIEDDLFHDHAAGRMSSDERVRFLERFGRDGARLAFAQALVRRAEKDRPAVSIRRWVPLAAAAALTVVVGSVVVRQQRAAVPPAPASAGFSARAVDTPAPAPAPTPGNVELRLTLGTSRSETSGNSAALAADTPALVLRIRIDPADVFDRYVLEVRSSADRVVWRAGDLHRSGEREPEIVATIPSASLQAGSYEVSVSGAGRDGAAEALGFVNVSVHRNR